MCLKQTILPYLPQLKARTLTNRALATQLGVSEAHLSRTLKLLNFKRDPPTPKINLLETRKRIRTRLANSLPIKEAAAHANCSERTIYRYKKNA